MCADRDKAGLHPDLSLRRLLNALQFRKDHHVDEILNIGNHHNVPLRSKAHSVDSTISTLSSDTMSTIASSATSSSSSGGTNATSSSSSSSSVGISVCGMSLMAGTFTDDAVQVTRGGGGNNSSCSNSISSNNKKQVTFNNQHEEVLPILWKKEDSFTSMTTATTAFSVSSSSRSTTAMTTTTTTTTTPTKPSSLMSMPTPMEPPLETGPPSVITPGQLEKYQRLRVRVFVGRDRQGNPVLFERLGGFFGSGAAHEFSVEDWITLYIWDLERHFTEMRQAAIESEGGTQPIEKYVFFGDLEGVLRSVLTGKIWSMVPLMTKLARTVEAHYPEIVSHVVVYNVPKVAAAVCGSL